MTMDTPAWREEVLSRMNSMGETSDGAAVSPTDNATLIAAMKGVMLQNETIITNQTAILAKLNAGINVTIVT